MSKKQTTTAQSLPSGDSASYITRPKTKPDLTLKGKLNEWQNGYREFIPQGQKPSNRTMLKQLGGSSFYKSEGEKESSWSLHLNVDLTEGEVKQKPQLQEGFEGRMLLDNGGSVKVWLDTKNHKVNILTTLDCGPNIERQLLQAQGQMNVCISKNRQEIINTINK